MFFRNALVVLFTLSLIMPLSEGEARSSDEMIRESSLSTPFSPDPGPEGAFARHLREPELFDWPGEGDSLTLVDRVLFSSSFCSFIENDRLYVGAGTAILIFDISEPSNPTYLGYVYTDGVVWNIFVVEDTVYVANSEASLRIYDCSDPEDCREIGEVAGPGGYGYGVCVQGHYACLAYGSGGLLVVDLESASGPELVAQYDPLPQSYTATDVRLLGDLVFMTFANGILGDGKLVIIDFSNPAAPDTVRTIDTGGPARAIHVEPDATVYVANGYMFGGTGNLVVFDCSNPADPVEMGYYEDPTHYGLDVFVDGDRIYLANGYMGGDTPNFLLFDRAEIGPEMGPIGGYTSQDMAWGVTALDGIAYISDEWGGLDVVDCRVENDLRSLAIFDIGGYPQDVAVNGDTVYVAAEGGNIRVVDASDPENLQEVAMIGTSSWASAVEVLGDTLFVAEGWDLPAQGHAGIEVINVSDPENPEVLDGLDYGQTAHCYDLFLDGNLLYVAKGIDGVLIIDVSSKTNLQELTIYDTRRAFDIFVEDNIAYVADGKGGLLLLDVTDPSNPSPMGSLNPWFGTSNGVWVSETLAYIADGDMGLRIIDCADPWNPEQIGYLNTDGSASKVTVRGKRAYLTDGLGGFKVINVEDPSNPFEESSFRTTGEAHGVRISGDDIWVADRNAGLFLFRME